MPNYYNPYQQYYPQMYNPSLVQPIIQQPTQTQQTAQSTIQNGGFLSVRNESEARNYPVAPGNSITFKDETAPYIYTKTMGFSQLDRPSFEKYKLVKEESEDEEFTENPNLVAGIKDDIQKLWSEVDALKTRMEKSTTTTTRRKKDGDGGHDEQSE